MTPATATYDPPTEPSAPAADTPAWWETAAPRFWALGRGPAANWHISREPLTIKQADDIRKATEILTGEMVYAVPSTYLNARRLPILDRDSLNINTLIMAESLPVDPLAPDWPEIPIPRPIIHALQAAQAYYTATR